MALVHFSGQATTFGAIEPGVCFAAELRAKTLIGLKIRDDRGGRGADACVIVWSDAGDAPAAVSPPPRGEWPVLALPEAMFQPSVDPAHIEADGAAAREAGMLLLAADRWLLVIGEEGGTALVDIKSGAAIRGLKAAAVAGIRFRAWRIAQRGLGDEYHTICRHVVKTESKVGFARG
jgi:hypothetical protein